MPFVSISSILEDRGIIPSDKLKNEFLTTIKRLN
jgi:hypothetical protein